MIRGVFIGVLGFSLIFASPAEAGPVEKMRECGQAFAAVAVKTGHRVRDFLAARGLMPYKYGDEAHAIDAVPKIHDKGWALFGWTYSSARKQFLKAMKSTANWERAGTEVDYGTYVEKPTRLEGRTIAGLLKKDAGLTKKGEVRVVVGKVIAVDVSKTSRKTGEALQFEVKVLTPDGIETIHLPGVKELHVLNLETEGRIKSLLVYLKGVAEGMGHNLLNYAKQVIKHPVRILIRPRDLEAEKEYPMNGFLRKEAAKHGLVYWLLNPIEYGVYRIHSRLRETRRKLGAEIPPEEYQYFLIPAPVRFLRHHTLTKGFSALVDLAAKKYDRRFGMSEDGKKFFEQPMEPSGLVNTAIGMGLFYVAYSIANDQNDEALVNRRQDVLDEHEQEWLKAIGVDYLLRMVKDRLAAQDYEGDDPEGEAVEEAFLRLHAVDNYYYYMMSEHEGDFDETNATLLKDPHTRILFSEVPLLKEKGPRSTDTLDVPADQQQPASDEEIREVMAAHHRFLSRRPILQAMARSPEELARILGDRRRSRREAYQATYRELMSDPYVRELLKRKEEGDITAERLEYLLMEAADLERRFSTYKVFGAVPKQEGRPVTLEELREARLASLEDDSVVEATENNDLVEVPPFNHEHLISRYGGDLTNIHMLRQTSPLLRSSGYLTNYIANGRQYRGLTQGEASRFMDVMRPDGNVVKQVRGANWFSESWKIFSRFVIAYDVANRANQWFAVEDEVMSALENPYASSRGETEVGKKFIDEILNPPQAKPAQSK